MFHVIVITNSIVQHVIQIKNEMVKHVNVSVKIIVHAQKDFSWNPRRSICENSKYLKSIADTSLIEYDEIISVMDIASTKTTNTMATNVPISCHSKSKI